MPRKSKPVSPSVKTAAKALDVRSEARPQLDAIKGRFSAKHYHGLALERPENPVFEVRSEDGVSTIEIYDVLDPYWGVSAAAFRSALRGIKGNEVKIRINSPGGSVFEGSAMFNDLLNFKAGGTRKVHVEVTGIAASAASVVAMAGDTITMGPGTFIMIHNPWSVVVGDAREMTAAAKVLDKIGAEMARVYSRRTGQDEADILEWMNEETWFNGLEAVSNGFADQIADDLQDVNASFDLSRYAHVPAVLKGQVNRSSQKPTSQSAGALDTSTKAAFESLILSMEKGIRAHASHRTAHSASPRPSSHAR